MGTSQSRKRLIGGANLIEAAERRDIDLVRRLVRRLIAEGADVNAQDNSGNIALIEAAGEGYVDVVRLLLAAGANVNAQDRWGATALMDAASGGHAEAIRQLLAAGANVNARNRHGTTALMAAADNGHAKVVRLLLAAGADVNAQNRSMGAPALIYAARDGHAKVVRLLLAAGANVNAQDRWGETALMLAERTGKTGVVRAINSFLANRIGLNELDRGIPFMDRLVYYHILGFL
jgi:ankyrin repeat protein